MKKPYLMLRSRKWIVPAVLVLGCIGQTTSVYAESIFSRKSTERIMQEDRSRVKIQGIITDTRGELLIGATVMEKGTTNGAAADIEGKFELLVNPDAVLTVSFIGYKPQEVQIKGKTYFEIQLEPVANSLDEVVVVGYTSQKKVNLSGSVTAVSADVIENRPITNVGVGLQGAVPNLNIEIPSGSANSTPKFNVRGYASINGDGGAPLILVDNIPTTPEELTTLNPNDIESMTVLKDASSAAIYGARAAFGVVLITTKSAKSGKMAVSVNAYWSTRKVTRLPDIVTDPYLVMKYKNDGAYPLYNLYSEAQMQEAKKFSENPGLNPVVVDPDDPNRWLYFGHTDWMKETYNDFAPSYTANFSISQRMDKAAFYFSGEYFRQDGMLRYGNDIYERYNLREKVSFDITDWLTVKNNTSFTYKRYNEPSFGRTDWGMKDFFHMVNRENSLELPKNPDGTWTKTGADLLGRLQDGGRKKTGSNGFTTTFGVDIALIKGIWDVKADATFRRDYEERSASYFQTSYREGPNTAIKTMGDNPSARNDHSTYKYNVFNVYTDFHKTFAEKHFVQALVGFNQETSKSDDQWFSRADLISNGFPTVSLATGNMNMNQTIKSWSVRSGFFRLNYIYNNKYILELNGRYDGSSKFPKDDRFGFFPSVSGAWIVTEEPFFNKIKESIRMSHFKIRASYGSLGNQNVGEYAYIPTMSTGKINSILDGDRPLGVGMPGIVSPSLTWEKVETVNVGADVNFFDNRLTAVFDYYNRFTTGMLTKGKTLPSVLGTSEPNENAADLKTIGWELSLGWQDQFEAAGSPFRYSVKFTLSDNRTTITKFDNKTKSLRDHYEGKRIGEIWGLQTEGFFASDEEVAQHADQSAVGEDDQSYKFYKGDLKFKDVDGNGKIDKGDNTVSNPGDFSIIGNSSTRLPYSIDLSLDWKGFDFRAFLQGVGKKDWYPAGSNHYFWGIYAQPWTNVQKQNLDHWTPENPNGYFPRVKAYIAESTGSELACPQTKYLQDASYLRMKNLTLGYTLPQSWTRKAKIERVRFYFSAENLFEISHLKANLDPEAVSEDSKIYPYQRSFSFGVNLNF